MERPKERALIMIPTDGLPDIIVPGYTCFVTGFRLYDGVTVAAATGVARRASASTSTTITAVKPD